MTATTEGRNTKRRDARRVSHLVNPAATIYAGTLVTLLAANGNAVSGGTAAAGAAVGVAEDTVTGDGVKRIEVTRNCFQFGNSAAADLIGRADIGTNCYIADNQTVAKTDGGAGARKVAGKIIDVDAAGVWVEVG